MSCTLTDRLSTQMASFKYVWSILHCDVKSSKPCSRMNNNTDSGSNLNVIIDWTMNRVSMAISNLLRQCSQLHQVIHGTYSISYIERFKEHGSRWTFILKHKMVILLTIRELLIYRGLFRNDERRQSITLARILAMVCLSLLYTGFQWEPY